MWSSSQRNLALALTVYPPQAVGDRGPAPAGRQAPALRRTSCYLARLQRLLRRPRAYRSAQPAQSGIRLNRRIDTTRWPNDDSAIETRRSRLDLQEGIRRRTSVSGRAPPAPGARSMDMRSRRDLMTEASTEAAYVADVGRVARRSKSTAATDSRPGYRRPRISLRYLYSFSSTPVMPPLRDLPPTAP